MKKVETGPEDGQVELLKEVVRNSRQVSIVGLQSRWKPRLKIWDWESRLLRAERFLKLIS
jgi:hypothetical protein